MGSLAIVGEGPSSEEMVQGWPFVGPSGKLLQQVFDAAGIDRHSIWITNALLCQRPYDPAKLAKAVECCQPRLKLELEWVHATAVCALGVTAIDALQLPVNKISDARGTLQTSQLANLPTIAALHPAAILRGGAGDIKGGGKQKMNVDAQYVFLEADVAKAYRLATDTGTASEAWIDSIELITDSTLNPIGKINALIGEAHASGILGIDLEWGKDGTITWLGLASTSSAISIYWPHLHDSHAAFIAVRNAAESALPKIFHNLQADVKVWAAQIGPVNGTLEDTMLMHHAAFPGAAHDLQNVASQFFLVPPWKASRGNEEKQAKKDASANERAAKKSIKQMQHEARNLDSANQAKERKTKRIAKHDARNTAAHWLKLIED